MDFYNPTTGETLTTTLYHGQTSTKTWDLALLDLFARELRLYSNVRTAALLWATDLMWSGLTLTHIRRCIVTGDCPFINHQYVPFYQVGSEMWAHFDHPGSFEIEEALRTVRGLTHYETATLFLKEHGWTTGAPPRRTQ